MKVAIDSGPLNSGDKIRGIGFHTKELVNELEKLQSKQSLSLRDESFKVEVVDFSKTDLSKYDIVHYQYFRPHALTLPFRKRAKRCVVTIHDLIRLIYPDNYPAGIKGWIKFQIQKFNLRNVDAVITISETSKKDIVRFLNIPPDKIHVTYLAPQSSENLKQKTKQQYNLPEKFVLYVGDINYNKNIPNLIKACKLINIPLVIVGKQASEIDSIVTEMKSIKGPRDFLRFLIGKPHPEMAHYRQVLDLLDSNVIRLGYVADIDEVYKKATVYCQPSLYEGFGLPLLEAFERNTPVVASQTQALVEVGGGASLYVDPKSPKDIAAGLKRIIEDKKLADGLIKKGKERIKDFSWKKSAAETLKIYKEIL